MKYYLILLFLLSTQNLFANLLINEVLSNEPGGTTSLEWIELYNNSESSLQLSDYTLIVNSDTIALPARTIEPYSYLIVCRNLFSVSSEASFESYWGDGSQVWGDTEYEFLTTEPIEVSFSLKNDSGLIVLLQQQDTVSVFSWDETGQDGISWERKFTDSTLILQSKSNIKSTPGYINSITLVQKDLTVESVSVVIEDFIPFYTFTIANRSLTNIDDGILQIYDSTETILLNSYSVPSVLSDSAIQFEISYEFYSEQMYEFFVAVVAIPFDERNSNDTLKFIAVSQEYPPILISEFLANPQPDKETEWIEIYNRSSEAVDLQNWFIGDALNVYPITSEPIIMQPNQYVILTKSRNDFLYEYPHFIGTVIELNNWAVLNNEIDTVRLIDIYAILADKYAYSSLYDDNYTAAREINQEPYRWGRSSYFDGTPGYDNIIFETISNDNLQINLNSKYISPDGDGFDDYLYIELKVPVSDSYTMKLYDVDGNVVKLFFDEQAYIPNQIKWDGLNYNQRLPIGIYILYLSTDEGLSTKETTVIAR